MLPQGARKTVWTAMRKQARNECRGARGEGSALGTTSPTLRRVMALGLVLLLGMMGRSVAEESTNAAQSALEKFATQDYLFGTWGGLRTDLSQHGVDFEFFYIASNPHNLDGGIKTGSA